MRAAARRGAAASCPRARPEVALPGSRQQPRPGPAGVRPRRGGREQFLAAVDMRPDFAIAQNNLGVALRPPQDRRGLGAFPPPWRAANLGLAPRQPRPAPFRPGPVRRALTHCREAVRLGRPVRGPQQPRQRLPPRNTGKKPATPTPRPSASPDLALAHANLGLAPPAAGQTRRRRAPLPSGRRGGSRRRRGLAAAGRRQGHDGGLAGGHRLMRAAHRAEA